MRDDPLDALLPLKRTCDHRRPKCAPLTVRFRKAERKQLEAEAHALGPRLSDLIRLKCIGSAT